MRRGSREEGKYNAGGRYTVFVLMKHTRKCTQEVRTLCTCRRGRIPLLYAVWWYLLLSTTPRTFCVLSTYFPRHYVRPHRLVSVVLAPVQRCLLLLLALLVSIVVLVRTVATDRHLESRGSVGRCPGSTWMAKRSDWAGDFGGGSLERLRQRLAAQWLDLTLGVPSRPEPPGAR